MRFTTRFQILVSAFVLFVILGGLTYHQYLLQKEVNAQSQFDVKVMQQDLKIWKGLEARLTPTATPTATLKEVRPTVSAKVTISKN